MGVYTIRPGFTINLFGTIYQGGQEVDLDDLQLELNKHKLEGIETDVEPIEFGSGGSNSNDCCYPAPYVSGIQPVKMLTNQTITVSIEGSFFTPDTTVAISSGTVDWVDFISSNQIDVEITSSVEAGLFDLTIDNGESLILPEAIEYFDSTTEIIDLRLGGTDFGEAAIEMRSEATFQRRTDGLIFRGYSAWSSWARFVGGDDKWVWNRAKKKKLTWIFQNSSNFMVGLGSRANDPNSASQWTFGELFLYSSSGSGFESLYGNTGTPGTYSNQSINFENKADRDIIKLVITNNGENGGTVSVYKLPSADVADWFDDSQLLGTTTISGFGSNEPEIMPFTVPSDGTGTKFIGFILENE